MILHIDMDAFFASIEQAANPRLKGRPLIVGTRENKRHTVVCAASYEAKALGIGSGMPSEEAFKICPELNFVPAEQGKYIWTSGRILELIKGYGFETVYVSIDEFQVDVGNRPPSGGLLLARDIQRKIHENFSITASVGIAKNCLLAKLASKLNKPNGVAALDEANLAEILAKTPVEKLCGVGESTKKVFWDLGVKTCLDLYAKSPDFLEKNLGKNGLNLYASLHAEESLKPVSEPRDDEPKSMGHSYTLPRSTANVTFINAWIRLLSDMVAERLRNAGLAAATVHLWLNGPEIGNFGCQKTFPEAIDDGYEIYRRCLKIMAKLGPKTPKIRALGVTGGNLTHTRYPPLFEAQRSRESLLGAMDLINGRFGDGSIYPAVITLTRKMP
ncbi:MAG: DNA polymerase IV [Candidatus Omnitrophica bacterium]|nr:DNA polymerase IV [Candidatus Omnitrophota bacterium]